MVPMVSRQAPGRLPQPTDQGPGDGAPSSTDETGRIRTTSSSARAVSLPGMEHEDIAGQTFEQVPMRDARFRYVDLSGARFEACDLHDVRLRGIESRSLEIDGEVLRLVVQGIDVMPLVEAERLRLEPDYSAMTPDDPAGFVRAWDVLERRWAETVERALGLDPDLLHQRVDGEWSSSWRPCATSPTPPTPGSAEPSSATRIPTTRSSCPSTPCTTLPGPTPPTSARPSTTCWPCAPTGRPSSGGCSRP